MKSIREKKMTEEEYYEKLGTFAETLDIYRIDEKQRVIIDRETKREVVRYEVDSNE